MHHGRPVIFQRVQSSTLSSAVLRASIEIAADAFICVDAAHRIIFFNRGAAEIFGYEPAEVMGRPLDILLPDRSRGMHGTQMATFAGSPEQTRLMAHRGDVFGLRKNGDEFPAEASITKVDVDGQMVLSVALRDITERRRFEQENAELVEELRAAIAARDDLLSVVSHDLRNPVNAVKMLAAAILRIGELQPLRPQVAEHADVMLQAARQMDALIEDLLDVSRLESGRMSMTLRPSPLADLVADAIEVLVPAAEAADVRVTAEIPSNLPLVDVDPDRLTQVLSNLVSNSIKYTPRHGSVVVRGALDGDVVRVTVADTGIGIPEADLPRVFDRFWQSKRTNRSGAGLGLTIARGIVRAHGGRIWIESPPGLGTSVHFTVPRSISRGQDAGASPRAKS